MPVLNRWLGRAGERKDLVFALFMLTAVVMIVLPLPAPVIDVLIGTNMALTLLMLVVAFYASRAVDFSSLPSLLLISTLFRIALSISTTRLILRDGDAGHIVATFGEFVIGGEIVIGLVLFLVIVVAQFVVITKGAERVAEVAARFSLDALPGKQMSIDNDLRNGDIDQAEARTRRMLLERESQLFGAMDGAMKFVKGDAIASLVILAVNLLGGLAIGIASRGMSLVDAGRTYSILSVGDGLVAQLPSLLTALAAGLIVTRVSTARQRDLGADIAEQLTGNRRALWLACAVVVLLALVPGFPAVTFVGIAVVLGLLAYGLSRAAVTTDPVAPPQDDHIQVPAPATLDLIVGEAKPLRVVVHVDGALCESLDLPVLELAARDLILQVQDELGIDLPGVAWRGPASHPEPGFRVDIDGCPVARGFFPPGCVRIVSDSAIQPDGEYWPQIVEGAPLVRGQPTYWLPLMQANMASMLSTTIQPPEAALLAYVRRVLLRSAPQFIGLQEVHSWLQHSATAYPDLVNEALRSLPLQPLSMLLRQLASDGVPLTNARSLLEAIVEQAPRNNDTGKLNIHVRSALAHQICHRHAGGAGVIRAIVFAHRLEQSLRECLRKNARADLPLPVSITRPLLDNLRQQLAGMAEIVAPVVVVADDLRGPIQSLLREHDLDEPVLAFSDLRHGYVFDPVAQVDVATKGDGQGGAHG